ncbi:hypothetical protein GCM10023081_46040 [Arthrobacter ginkgonis]|uniref:EthD domain-containing protein n=1 Tax=Arthrobacter ginkgonis TaxID=1630594 RepID=A0ABP7DEM1_9MICC
MTDRATMENEATVASLITLKRPKGLTREQFDSYWANVHAPIMARMPGIWAYTLHHVEAVQLPYWRLPLSIQRLAPEDYALEGVAELLYLDQDEAMEAYRLSDGPGGYTHTDAQNAFWVGLFYQSNKGSRTLKDNTDGREPAETVLLAFQYKDSVERSQGHEWVRRFADRAAAAEESVRVRRHTFEPYDNDALDPGLPVGMRHTVFPDEALDAVVEIAASDRSALSRVLDLLPVNEEDLQVLASAHAYRRRERNDMVQGGQITRAGVRTPAVARLIDTLGAVSQDHPGLHDLMLTGIPADTTAASKR